MLQFRSSNPNRPPDWRWQLANYLADNNLRMTRSRGDSIVGLARDFAVRLTLAVEEIEHTYLCESNPPLYEAWVIYNNAAAKSTRWVIEARLLANEELSSISVKTGISIPIIEHYRDMFFDVRSRLDAPDYITTVVLGEAFIKGITLREYDILWKMFGYWGGEYVLDFLIHRFNDPVKPVSAKGIPAFLADEVRSQLQLKAALAIRLMPIDMMTRIEIMHIYQHMLLLEKDVGGGGGGTESFKAAIQTLLQNVPWTKNKKAKTSSEVIDQIDVTPVGLRSDELLRLGAGETLANSAMILSAKFPDAPAKEGEHAAGQPT